MRTCGETHEIDAVRHGVHFVKVVDAPNQPPFAVSPGSKIFKVEIAHSQERRRNPGLSADLTPNLYPPVESGAQERKKPQRHLLVFERKRGSIQRDAGSYPLFITRRRLANLHDRDDVPNSSSTANPMDRAALDNLWSAQTKVLLAGRSSHQINDAASWKLSAAFNGWWLSRSRANSRSLSPADIS